jgi:DNA-binding LacI/PurR family transcriptional regulator
LAVGLKEIAEVAGVSIPTVSRVLNGKFRKYGISNATASRIKEIAVEKGYSPNILAQRLVHQKSRVVGVLLPSYESLATYVNSKIFQGMGDLLSSQRYHLEIISSEGLDDVDAEVERIFKGKQIDGLLLWYGKSLRFTDNLVNAKEFPYCYVQYERGDTDRHAVVSTNVQGAIDAVTHLQSLGHKDISIAVFRALQEGCLRLKGFQEAIEAQGRQLREDLIIDTTCAANLKEIYVDIEKLKRAVSMCTAIFVTSDLVAVKIIHILADMGIKVPEDISLVGFDGLDIGEYMLPPLTTVRQNGYEIGTRSAQRLLELMHGNTTKKGVEYVKTELVIRGSTRPYLE